MATGTKLMKEISDQFLICKICLETFKEPKTLVCLHTFCAECLQKQTEADSSRPTRYNVYSRYITCPLCRKKTEIPSGGVRRLQDNFLVSNLTAVVNKRSRSKVPPCEICHTVRPRSNEACSKCLDCSKLLCKNCVDLHMTTKVTQKHSLIDIEGEKDIECKSHPEEIVRFYCEPCEQCICVVCTFQDHRDHEVCCFSDGFAKYKAALDVKLQECKGRLGETGSRLKMIDKYERVVKEVRERIRDLAIAYISKVRTTEKELLKKIDDLAGDNVLNFIENKSWLQESYENLQSTCNLTEIIMKDKGVEMLLLKKEIQQKMSVLMEPDLPTIPSDMLTQMQFVPGDVKLGYISVPNGTEVNGVVEECAHELKCQDTQTESVYTHPVTDSSTTMSSDVTVKHVDGGFQTEAVKQVTRETCTEKNETRDKGVHVYSYDSKTKGTMTSLLDTRSLKIQTDKSINYDQYCQTVAPEELKDFSAQSLKSLPGKGQYQHEANGSPMTNGISGTTSGVTASPKMQIRSRKIQTQISSIGLGTDEDFVSSLSPKPEKKSRFLSSRQQPQMVNVETNTVLPIRVVPEMFSKETSPEQVVLKDTSTMACPDSKTINTQTLRVRRRDTGVATDHEGHVSKSTLTEKTRCVDSETSMPQVLQESKVTWTEKLPTADRATCTSYVNTSDRATSTGKVNQGDKSTQVKPDSRLKATNTLKTLTHEKEIQTRANTRDSTTNPIKELNQNTAEKEVINQSVSTATEEIQSRRESLVEKVDMDVETDVIESECKTTETYDILTSHASTETLCVMTSDKETGTPQIHLIDQWTFTPQPQMINTGVSPPRPATLEVGVGTNPVITMESGTYTEVVTYRESGTETTVTVADNETLTERVVVSDAQTGIEIRMEDSETSTDVVKVRDEGSMTSEILIFEKPETECKETQVSPDREIIISNRSTLQTSIQEVQTETVNINCTICEHSSSSLEDKSFTDSCTMPQLPLTQDVGTMALSIISAACDVSDSETQTSSVILCDKSIATSTDFEEFEKGLTRESRDAATSTESLPYIGLLSEIDVDDIIVVPEAQFDFMLDDYTTDESDVEMVDTETWTDSFESAEAGTQTLITATPPETSLSDKEQGDNLVSVGVNTVSKMTFEKETSTPIRHLFSKGTMTFYIAKTDKATSTFSQTKQIGSKFGGCSPGKSITPRVRVEDKDTMTNGAERHDVSTETDPTALDGRITQCISKLRNVSEKLNSPTPRSCEGDVFFGKSFLSKTKSSDSSGQSSPTVMFDSTSSREGKISPITPEDDRQKQLQQLLAETQAILKSKEQGKQDQGGVKPKHIRNERSPVRKAQPITTLKGRGQGKSNETSGYRTQSLPRQFSVDSPSNVRLGSQVSPPSRLPLLRYNSAPGRIATVPTQKLQDLKKATQSQCSQKRGNSPSKIPIRASPEPPSSPPQPETYTQAPKSAKPQQRPSLPAICETRTPSSCSDISTSSFMSAASGDSVTPSLTASIVSSDQTDYSGNRRTSKESTTGESADEVGKAQAPAPPAKKDKGLGFMQRLLSKKKKEPEKKKCDPPPVSSPTAVAKLRQKQSKPEPPKEPPLPKKSRPFVYVRQRIMSIQHDNEDELEEKKKDRKSKQKKEKGEKNTLSPKCKHGKGKKSRESDSDLSDRH